MNARRRAALVLGVLLGVGGLWLWRALTPPSPLAALSDDFTLRDVTIVSPGRERVTHATLVVRRGMIRSLTGGDGANGGAGALARLRGAYVLPGLVDMHAHLPPDNLLKLSGYFLFLYLAHGVTAIRDVGDPDGTSVAAARTARPTDARSRADAPRVRRCARPRRAALLRCAAAGESRA